jgi:hypothetical protein
MKRWIVAALAVSLGCVQAEVPDMEPSATWAESTPWTAEPWQDPRLAESGEALTEAPPGCVLKGTECRICVQTCHYHCGDGRRATAGCGWCLGWWDPPPPPME